MQRQRQGQSPGFTLVELLIAISVVAILLSLGVPGFRNFILMQRLKSINAQLVTDLHLARSEAAARNEWVRIAFNGDATLTCYTIYASGSLADQSRCDCLRGPGAACSTVPSFREVRTVQVPRADGVAIEVVSDSVSNTGVAFDPSNGRIRSFAWVSNGVPLDSFKTRTTIDTARTLQTEVTGTGRVNVCAPASTSVGAPACP